jgi:hypothetical protein
MFLSGQLQRILEIRMEQLEEDDIVHVTTLTTAFVVPFFKKIPIGPSAFVHEILRGAPATTPPSRHESGIVKLTP